MIELGQIGYLGLNQDMNAQDERRNQFYYDAQNATVAFNRELSQNVASNERGNKLLVKLPNVLFSNTVGGTPLWDTYSTDLLYTEEQTAGVLPANASGIILTHPTATTYNAAFLDIGNNTIQGSYFGPQFDNSFYSSTTAITSQIILGGGYVNDSLIVISTDGNNQGHLLVWEITYNNDYEATVYLRYFAASVGMSKSYPLTKVRTWYESEGVQKVYFTDGLNQLRSVNIRHNLPFYRNGKTIDATPEWNYSSPQINNTSNGGGRWVTGASMVQYGYRLFTKHGPATKLSPLSHLAPILKDLHGIPTGEYGDTTVRVTVSNIDTNFEYIEIYRFHHDDSGALSVYLIHEGTIDGTSMTVIDRGTDSQIRQESDIEGLRYGAGGPFIPLTFEIKDNRIFIANITETQQVFDYDARAYSFDNATTGNQEAVLKNAGGGTDVTIDGTNPTWPSTQTLDAINPSVLANPGDAAYDIYRFQKNGTTQGGEGPNVSYTFERVITPDEYYFKYPERYQKACYKLNEPYRFGVEFFDKYGNFLFVHWIADIRIPELMRSAFGGSLGNATIYNGTSFGLTYPKFTLNNLNTLPENVKYFRIVRASKSSSDRKILSQGYLNNTLYSSSGGTRSSLGTTRVNYHKGKYMPYYSLGYYKSTVVTGYIEGAFPLLDTDVFDIDRDGTAGENADDSEANVGGVGRYIKKSYFMNFYCPELGYTPTTIEATKDNYMRIVAGAADYNGSGPATDAWEYNDVDSGGSSQDLGYTLLGHWTNIFDAAAKFYTEGGGGSGASTKYRSGIESRHTLTQFKAHYLWTKYITDSTSLNNSTDHCYNGINSIEATQRIGYDIGIDDIEIGGDSFVNHMVVWGTIADVDLLADNERIGVIAKGCKSFVLTLGGDLVDYLTPSNEGVVYRSNRPAFIVGEYMNPTVNPYGGNSYTNRQGTYYIPCTDVIEITSSTMSDIIAYGGDTFPQLFRMLMLDYNEDTTGNYNANLEPEYYNGAETLEGLSLQQIPDEKDLQSIKQYITLPIESYINMEHLNDDENLNLHKSPKMTYDKIPGYNQVYNKENNYELYIPKPSSVNATTDFVTMTRYSDVKINNQSIDGLARFRPNNFNYADAALGPISAAHVFGDFMYVVQHYGTGVWLINPNAVVSSSTGPMLLGTGAVLQDYKVLSSIYGSAYKFGSVVGSKGVYVLDMSKRKFVLISQGANPISDIKGMYAKLVELQKTITDDMYGNGTGIRLHYDPLTYNVYVSIYYDTTDTGDNVISTPSEL